MAYGDIRVPRTYGSEVRLTFAIEPMEMTSIYLARVAMTGSAVG
jgi:hypothetical protein